MDRKTCRNYEPKEPTPHPGRVFAEDLKIGMVIKRHNAGGLCRLVVILSEPGDSTAIKSLQIQPGFAPHKCDMYLAGSGLQPYRFSGKWSKTWCEEVT